MSVDYYTALYIDDGVITFEVKYRYTDRKIRSKALLKKPIVVNGNKFSDLVTMLEKTTADPSEILKVIEAQFRADNYETYYR